MRLILQDLYYKTYTIYNVKLILYILQDYYIHVYYKTYTMRCIVYKLIYYKTYTTRLILHIYYETYTIRLILWDV